MQQIIITHFLTAFKIQLLTNISSIDHLPPPPLSHRAGKFQHMHVWTAQNGTI